MRRRARVERVVATQPSHASHEPGTTRGPVDRAFRSASASPRDRCAQPGTDRRGIAAVCVGPAGMRIGYVPGNAWSTAGELLIDPGVDPAAACDQLVAGLRAPALADHRSERRTHGRRGVADVGRRAARHRMPLVARERFRVEQVEINSDWATYLAGRSRNLQRHVRRSQSKAEQAGATRLRVLDRLSSETSRTVCAAASRWKIEVGKEPRAARCSRRPARSGFISQARQLAEWGQLRLVELEHKGQPMAFEYGWASKGVYFSPKVAYDEAFGRFSPGQLLRAALLERFHAEPGWQQVDYLGPTSRATAEWSTRGYTISRVIVAVRPLGRVALGAYHVLRPLVRQFSGRRLQNIPAAEATGAGHESSADAETGAPLTPQRRQDPLGSHG